MRTWVDKLDVLWVPAHTLPLLRQPSWLRKGKPLKTVVTIHGIEYEWLPAYENWLQRWYLPLSTQYAVRNAQRIIAVSEFTKRQIIERLGADSKKIEVVYEGVSFKDTPCKSLQGVSFLETFLEKWGLRPGRYLLFVGTVQPRKNLERLIEAYSNLTPSPSPNLGEGGPGGVGEAVKLVIAGKLGWGYERVVELAKQHGVMLTGYISDADRYTLLQNALVYVQPSITEGFGLPVLEAMAAGVPVVSSRGGALAEVVGKAGILFDPLDVEEIGHSLSLVIHSHSLQKELIEKGRERVRKFSWENAAKKTYRILTSLV
jgi:glycosyltransferase involved in cell wall biosynthesis